MRDTADEVKKRKMLLCVIFLLFPTPSLLYVFPPYLPLQPPSRLSGDKGGEK